MTTPKKQNEREDFVLHPNFLTAPLFPPLPQQNEYSVLINHYMFTTGCSDGLGGKQNQDFLKALDTRHFDLFCLIIDKFHRKENFENGIFKTSYREILTLLKKSDGQKNIEYIRDLLKDLKYTHIRIHDTDSGMTRTFNAIDTIETLNLTGKTILTGIKFHDDFVQFLDNVEKLALFKLSEKLKMPSKIAQAIYTFIPSRAVYRNMHNPFEINLATLMLDLRLEVPSSKSKRKEFFTQHKNSIISQLDKAILRENMLLRVSLSENRDKTDYKLQAWTEKLIDTEPANFLCVNEKSKLFTWWVAGGRTKSAYYDAISKQEPLNMYEIDLLLEIGLDVKKDEVFFTLAKALVETTGLHFDEMLSILKERTWRDEINNAFTYFCGTLKKTFNIQPDLFE